MPDGSGHLGQEPRSDIGPILDYLRDTTKLPPELVRFEQFRFELHAVNQVQTFITQSQRIDPNYIFAMRRVKGYVSRPEVNGEYIHHFTFNVSDQGRARRAIFDDDIPLSALVSDAGPAHDMAWDSFYVFIPGADLQVDWAVTLADLPAISNIRVGISITGDMVRVKKLGNGALVLPGME